MSYTPPFNGGRINMTLAGNSTSAGAGYTLASTGTVTLAGGDNITLSQNGNAVTISGPTLLGLVGTQTHGISNLGNTSGTSGVITGTGIQYALAGGNNVTLSQSVLLSSGTVTISAANQTVQTQNLVDVTLAGNSTSAGAGYALMSSGTMTLAGGNNITLSQNGNAVTISGGAGGAAGTNTIGMSNLGNTSGTSGVVTGSNVQFAFAGGNNVTLSQSLNGSSGTITISAGAGGGGGKTGSYFDNMLQQNSVQGLTFTSVSTGMFGRVIIQPLSPANELFPYAITASTMRLGFSNSGSSNSSAAHTSSFYFGIYTRVNSTQLSLLNSVSTSWGLAANISNSNSYRGARWLSFHSSQFSVQPALSEGVRYFFALLARTSSNSYASHSLAGMHIGHSIQRSGFMATTASSNTSFNAWHPFMGVHSLTTHTALPGSIANSEINKASVYANFIPQVIFDAGLGVQN